LGSSGVVWLGGSAGLSRYNPANDSWTTWRMAEGLVGSTVSSIAIESQQVDGMPHDILWIGTNAGVSRFDAQLGTFQSFTVADGLPSNSVTKVLVLSNGTKLFATDAGIARYTGR
jgi:ligand-binding sensor domain-containing protein